MFGTIAATYRCRAHGRLYTYEAQWENAGDTVAWEADIRHDGRVALTQGCVADVAADSEAAVRSAVERFIEDYSRSNPPAVA